MTRIALFCSGSGSNAEQIMHYFQTHASIEVALMVCNRKEAKAFLRAENHKVKSVYISTSTFLTDPERVRNLLMENEIDLIVLAGFLLLIPGALIEMFPYRILNIHPALLPAFGGKGMYGHFVHKAVKQSGANQTGITIHEVDDRYDHGKIVFQATCPVYQTDTSADIADRVLKLEHKLYPFVIEQFIHSKTEIRAKTNV